MPLHPVIRQDKNTTKVRIVYDGSATSNESNISLNDYLQVGPNLIPKLFNILLRFQCYGVALIADIEKAFLMIGIKESDCDMLQFLWFKEPLDGNSEIIWFQFTRFVFGLRPSPAILGAVIAHHLNPFSPPIPR